LEHVAFPMTECALTAWR